jgi:hypothetical protein
MEPCRVKPSQWEKRAKNGSIWNAEKLKRKT